LVIAILNQLLLIMGMTMLSNHFGFHCVLYGILIPQRLAVGFLGYAFDYVPHNKAKQIGIGYQTTHRISRIFGGEALSIVKQQILSIVLARQDAHVIHHLYPQLPFYKYHAVWNKHEKEFYKLGVDQTSMF